ncbi:MAG: LapA family protein [Sedimentisphaerales bacterium]|nr:LapA family protein [Sedimentisphaerales bacterium]
MNKLKHGLILVVVLLAIIVIIQNTKAVETKLLFVTITMPRALLLLVTFLVGFSVGVFFLSFYKSRTTKAKKG